MLLRQLGRSCQLVYANMNWSLAAAQLDLAVHVAFATKSIQLTKLALGRRGKPSHAWLEQAGHWPGSSSCPSPS